MAHRLSSLDSRAPGTALSWLKFSAHIVTDIVTMIVSRQSTHKPYDKASMYMHDAVTSMIELIHGVESDRRTRLTQTVAFIGVHAYLDKR